MPAVPDIFGRLIMDHELHRDLLDALGETQGECEERSELFERFTKEVKSHAAAEEQALYSTMMRKPETTDETRHSVAEHQRIELLLDEWRATGVRLDDLVTHVVVHELGHHFGFSDDTMHRLEDGEEF